MLDCRFSLEARATNVEEKITKYFLKVFEVLKDADGYVLIYV